MQKLHLVALAGCVLHAVAGCGADGTADVATVDFPAGREDRALHCHTVLELRIQQISGVAGEGRFGEWAASDYAEAQLAAAGQADPTVVQGDFETLRERVDETTGAFDANSDQRIDGNAELEELSRHVDLCMQEFLPES